MKIKLITCALLFVTFSCNTNDKKTTDSSNNETNKSENVDAQKKQLNEESRACISLMNSLEQDLNAANASHDIKTSSAIQFRIDSAAEENVKIGQKLMALESK